MILERGRKAIYDWSQSVLHYEKEYHVFKTNGRPTDCTPTTKVTKQKLMSELLNTRSVT